MREEIKGACLIAFFAAILMLMFVIPVAMAATSGKLWLEPVSSGTYIDDSEDAWFIESYVTPDTEFNLEIFYHHGADIHHLYLLVAVNRNPAGNVIVTVDGTPVGSYDGVITTNNNALITVPETIPDYQYPGHGIYKYGSSTHFEVVEIDIPVPDGILKKGETITVPVEIELIDSAVVKVHFDAVGADGSMEAIAFVPPSHDVTHHVPEFSTIAIPIASILGLLFFFNHRKRREK